MLEHVLVPLDGSKLAEAALIVAQNMISPTGRISLLSTINLPEIPFYEYYPTPHSVTQEAEASAAKAFTVAQDYLRGIAEMGVTPATITVDFEVTSGDPPQAIVNAARQHKVDAIVMSTHGRSGVGLWLFGSVTHRVLATATCPVVVVSNRMSTHDIVAQTTSERVGMN